MSLVEVLNQTNKSSYYLHDTNLNFHKRNWIVGNVKSYKTNNKFGFWNTSKTIEINEEVKYKPIKSIKLTNPKFPFLFDPYLEEEEIDEISPVIPIKISSKKSPVIENDLDKFELDLDFTFLEDIKQEYSTTQLISMLNYKHNRLFDVINTFDKYVSNHKSKDYIIKEVSRKVLKSKLYGKKLKKWIENFPNMIDDKIKAIKNKTKPKNPNRQKASEKSYYSPNVSELRFKTVNRMLDSRGYYSVNSDVIKERIKELHKSRNLDIVNDIINSLDDQFGNDNDMIEFDENKQFQEYIKECEMRYSDRE